MSCFISYHLSNASLKHLEESLPSPQNLLDVDFKYLGFFLNPNGYKFGNWTWLYNKVEVHILFWGNLLLSRGGGGILTFIKSMLEIIMVY
jgi:hypothetical protein